MPLLFANFYHILIILSPCFAVLFISMDTFYLRSFPISLLVNFQEILEGVTEIDLVVNLKLQEEALLAKCLGRRICSECGGNYNIASIDIKGKNGSPGMYMAPLLPPPHCASKLITRADDTEVVVKERLRVYNEKVLHPYQIPIIRLSLCLIIQEMG